MFQLHITRAEFNEWIYNLETTSHHQIRGMLYDGYGYCALGIGVKGIEEMHLERMNQSRFLDALPKEFVKIIAHLNDEGRWSFREIADWLKGAPINCIDDKQVWQFDMEKKEFEKKEEERELVGV